MPYGACLLCGCAYEECECCTPTEGATLSPDPPLGSGDRRYHGALPRTRNRSKIGARKGAKKGKERGETK